MPVLEAKQQHDFEVELTRCLQLLRTFGTKGLSEVWPLDPVFGQVSGRFKSKLQAKHLDHHLKQFGV